MRGGKGKDESLGRGRKVSGLPPVPPTCSTTPGLAASEPCAWVHYPSQVAGLLAPPLPLNLSLPFPDSLPAYSWDLLFLATTTLVCGFLTINRVLPTVPAFPPVHPSLPFDRPPAYSWDLLLLATTTLVCGFLGLPPVPIGATHPPILPSLSTGPLPTAGTYCCWLP